MAKKRVASKRCVKRAEPAKKGARSKVEAPKAPERESMVGRVLINHQRRVGLVTSDCAEWTRMLRIGDDCVIDIVKVLNRDMVEQGWRVHECDMAAFKLANTLARSPLTKTAVAAHEIAAAQVAADMSKMTLEQLVAEYRRLTGDKVREFSRKVDAASALRRASAAVNVETPEKLEAAAVARRRRLAQSAPATKPTKENDMAAKKTKGKATKAKKTSGKAKKPATKKGASPKKAGGIGALVRELIGRGKGNEEIVDVVKQKFPGARTNAANVSWYRNDMKKGGKG